MNLTRVEDCIAKVGENLKSASKTAEEEVKSKLDGLKATHENNVDKIFEAKTKIEARVAEKRLSLIARCKSGKRTEKLASLNREQMQLKCTRLSLSNSQWLRPLKPILRHWKQLRHALMRSRPSLHNCLNFKLEIHYRARILINGYVLCFSEYSL